MSFRRAMKGGTCRRPFGPAFFSCLASVGETRERNRQSKKRKAVRRWPDRHRPHPCQVAAGNASRSWLFWSLGLPLESWSARHCHKCTCFQQNNMYLFTNCRLQNTVVLKRDFVHLYRASTDRLSDTRFFFFASKNNCQPLLSASAPHLGVCNMARGSRSWAQSASFFPLTAQFTNTANSRVMYFHHTTPL